MNRVKLCISVEETQFDLRERTFPDTFSNVLQHKECNNWTKSPNAHY